MNTPIQLKFPDTQVGDRHEIESSFEVAPFDLYGRHHEITGANASIVVTCVSEGLYVDLKVRATVRTECDRTLEPVDLPVEFGDSVLISGPHDRELCIEDWELDLACYTEGALPSEVPMQVFAPGTEPVQPERKEDEVDPRWRGLDDLFASGF